MTLQEENIMKTCPHCGKYIDEEAAICPSCGTWINRNLDSNAGRHSSAIVSAETERTTQIQHYHSEKGGHGFAAEDANALKDKLSGKK